MNLKGLLSKKGTSPETTTKKEEAAPQNEEKFFRMGKQEINVTEQYENDPEFKALYDFRLELLNEEQNKEIKDLLDENYRKMSLRYKELTGTGESNTATMKELFQKAANKKKKEKAGSKKEAKKEEPKDDTPYLGKNVIVELFNIVTGRDQFNYCVANHALEEDGSVIKAPIMIHSNNFISTEIPKCGEGAKVSGVLDWDGSNKRYVLMYPKVLQEAPKESPMAIFEAWLAKNSLAHTTKLNKVTMTDIGSLIKTTPIGKLEEALNEKFPDGFAVVDGDGPRRVFYY